MIKKYAKLFSMIIAILMVILTGCSGAGQENTNDKVGNVKTTQTGSDKKTNVEKPDIQVPADTLRIDISDVTTGVKLDGFGAEFDPHFWTDKNLKRGVNEKDWELIGQRVKDMRLQKIRIMVMPEWFEPQNDDNDPTNINWDGFKWDTAEMNSVYRVLDMAEENGIKVNITLWGAGASVWSWLATTNSKYWVSAPNNNDEWSENFAALVKYLIVTKKYTCLKEITPYNEPDWAYVNQKNEVVFEEYKEMAVNLDSRLKKENIRDKVLINLSDDASNPEWFLKSVRGLSDIADSFNSHSYKFSAESTDQQIFDWNKTLKSYADQFAKGKPYTVHEFGSNKMIDSHNQSDIDDYGRGLLYPRMAVNYLNSGNAGMLAWVLFDQYYDDVKMMKLGLWKFKDENWAARPIYYSWSLITRYTKVGSDIYPGKSLDENVSCTALKSSDGKWTYLVTNNSDAEKKVSIVNTSGGPASLNRYVFQESSLPTDSSIIKASGTAAMDKMIIQETIPAYSFIVLTDME